MLFGYLWNSAGHIRYPFQYWNGSSSKFHFGFRQENTYKSELFSDLGFEMGIYVYIHSEISI